MCLHTRARSRRAVVLVVDLDLMTKDKSIPLSSRSISLRQSFGLTEKYDMSELEEDITRKPRERSESPPGRLYFHRSGAAFVRVAFGGLVLFENLHWRDPNGVSLLPALQRGGGSTNGWGFRSRFMRNNWRSL